MYDTWFFDDFETFHLTSKLLVFKNEQLYDHFEIIYHQPPDSPPPKKYKLFEKINRYLLGDTFLRQLLVFL